MAYTIANGAKEIYDLHIKDKNLNNPLELMELLTNVFTKSNYNYSWQRERFFNELKALIRGDTNE